MPRSWMPNVGVARPNAVASLADSVFVLVL